MTLAVALHIMQKAPFRAGRKNLQKGNTASFEIFGRKTKIAPGLPFARSPRVRCISAGDEEEVIEIFGGCLLPRKCGGKSFCQKRAVMRVHKAKAKHKSIL